MHGGAGKFSLFRLAPLSNKGKEDLFWVAHEVISTMHFCQHQQFLSCRVSLRVTVYFCLVMLPLPPWMWTRFLKY